LSLNFEIRKNVLKFDQVLNQQREVIYKWRRRLLKSDDITDLIYEWLEDVNEVLHNNIENHKRNYENLDHFESLVSNTK
jgi:preprotein translocase subunit SecA